MQQQQLSRHRLESVALFLALIGIFFLPFSVAGDNLVGVGGLLFLCAGHTRQKLNVMQKHPMTWISLALIVVFAIGVSYHISGWQFGLHQFKKYGHKLILLPLLIPVFMQSEWRRYALNVFLMACCLAACLLLADSFAWISIAAIFHKSAGQVIAPIQFSILLAFALCVAANRALDARQYRWLYLAFCLVFAYCLFFINTERVGMLAALCMLALVFCQRFGYRGLFYALFVVPMLTAFLYYSSTTFQHRVTQAANETVDYLQHGKANGTSIGLRLTFVRLSLQLIQQRPWLGYGTGAFPQAYATTGGPIVEDGGTILPDPHNAYLNIACQVGLLGLTVFLLWLGMAWWTSCRLPYSERYLAQGLLIIFVVSNFFVPGLALNQIAIMTITFLALFLANSSKETRPTASKSPL